MNFWKRVARPFTGSGGEAEWSPRRTGAAALGTVGVTLLVPFLVIPTVVVLLVHGPGVSRPARDASCEAAAEECWMQLAFDRISNDSISSNLKKLTAEPHMAGTPANFRTADFVESSFKGHGWEVHRTDFPVLVSYPEKLRLSLVGPTRRNFSLHEAAYPEADPYSATTRATVPFLAYSPNGSVTAARVAYANYGRAEDFEELRLLGVMCCEGLVVLVRYGKIFRGDKVKNAEERGALAVVIYSDPADYAPNGTAPEAVYPQGPGLPPSGAQRGSIFLFKGDPQTPGWPSTFGGERLSPARTAARLPRIPALPLSYGNAAHILRAMRGRLAPPGWQGAIPGIKYRVGPGPATVDLSVQMRQEVRKIRNVVARIPGAQEPDRYVVLGNHRDAWVFGAADPNAGTATLLEVSRVLGLLYTGQGWRPWRSLLLCSWDAEEPGLVGSTEWVEANLPLLQAQAVAYLNVDVAAVAAPVPFRAHATPQLDDVIRHVAALVPDPEQEGASVLEAWGAAQNTSTPDVWRLGGGGSDHAPFLQHAGIAAADVCFSEDYPMYHSLYDDFLWLQRFVDPGFRRHVAVGRIWGGLALSLSTAPLLPFNYSAYAEQLQRGTQEVAGSVASIPGLSPASSEALLVPLAAAVERFESAASALDEAQSSLRRRLRAEWPLRSVTAGPAELRALNDRLMLAERGFLDPSGIVPGTEWAWFRHLVYGPEQGNGYGSLPFPALQGAVSAAKRKGGSVLEEQGRKDHRAVLGGEAHGESALGQVRQEVFRLARAIERATSLLQGELQ